MKKTIYTFMISSCFIIIATLSGYTQAGSLDLTFGTGGKVTTSGIGNDEADAYSIVIQSDGKIVVAGYALNGDDFDFALVRYNDDGTLDESFDSDGIVTTDIGSSNDYGNSVAIQSDGKIILAGSVWTGADYNFALVRYNSDGTLDTTFDTDGKVSTVIGSDDRARASMSIQGNGKILVTGDSWNGTDYDFTLVRYNIDGKLDSTFGIDGKVITPIGSSYDAGFSVATQSDDKILVAGVSIGNGVDEDFAVVRYNSDGTLDNTFSSDGKVTTAVGSLSDGGISVAVQNDGRIVVAGVSNNGSDDDFALVRYNTDGTLDNTFDYDGKVTTDFEVNDDFGVSVALQVDSKMVVAGFSFDDTTGYDFAVIRYNSDGTLDNTFSTDGKVTTDFEGSYDFGTAVAIQGDGKIVVAGVYTSINGNPGFAVVRYNASTVGIDENNVEENTLSISPNPFTNEVVIKGTKENEDIIIYNMLGEEMMRLKSKKAETNINTERLLPGFYFLNYREGNKMMSTKLVKL